MNGYIAFYNGRRVEVYAKDLGFAKVKAAEVLKVKGRKALQIAVVLCEKNTDGSAPGEQVFINTASL